MKEDRLEQYYDDLCAAQTRITQYEESNVDDDDEVLRLSEEIADVMDKFIEAISFIGSDKCSDEIIKPCFDAYREAIDGSRRPGKFCRKWKQILSTKVGVLELYTYFMSVKLNY